MGKELKSFTATLVRPDGMLGSEHSLGRRKGNKGVGKTVNPDPLEKLIKTICSVPSKGKYTVWTVARMIGSWEDQDLWVGRP